MVVPTVPELNLLRLITELFFKKKKKIRSDEIRPILEAIEKDDNLLRGKLEESQDKEVLTPSRRVLSRASLIAAKLLRRMDKQEYDLLSFWCKGWSWRKSLKFLSCARRDISIMFPKFKKYDNMVKENYPK